MGTKNQTTKYILYSTRGAWATTTTEFNDNVRVQTVCGYNKWQLKIGRTHEMKNCERTENKKGLSNKMYPSERFTLENAVIGKRAHWRHYCCCCCCCRCLANVRRYTICAVQLYVWIYVWISWILWYEFSMHLAERNSLMDCHTILMSAVRIACICVVYSCLLELITSQIWWFSSLGHGSVLRARHTISTICIMYIYIRISISAEGWTN